MPQKKTAKLNLLWYAIAHIVAPLILKYGINANDRAERVAGQLDARKKERRVALVEGQAVVAIKDLFAQEDHPYVRKKKRR